MLAILPELPGPSFVADFRRGSSRRSAAFAYRGGRHYSRRTFRWAILRAHIAELRETWDGLLARVRAVIFWKVPLMSSLVFIGWQLLISFPWAAFATIPLVALVVLQRNLLNEPPLPPIRQKPHICSLILTLLFGRHLKPLEASPNGEVDEWVDESDSDGESSGDEDEEEDEEEHLNTVEMTRSLTRAGGSSKASGHGHPSSSSSTASPQSGSRTLASSVKRFGKTLSLAVRGMRRGHSYVEMRDQIAQEIEEIVQEEYEEAMEKEEAKIGEIKKPSVIRRIVDPLDAVRTPYARAVDLPINPPLLAEKSCRRAPLADVTAHTCARVHMCLWYARRSSLRPLWAPCRTSARRPSSTYGPYVVSLIGKSGALCCIAPTAMRPTQDKLPRPATIPTDRRPPCLLIPPAFAPRCHVSAASVISLLAYLVLFLSTLAFLGLGYAMSLIWDLLIEWSLRLIGLLAFGPHMWYVGRHIESLEEAEQAAARAYEAGSGTERRAMREALRAELLAERRAQLHEELARYVTEVKAGSKKNPAHALLVQPRPNAGRQKFLYRPLLGRSKAYPYAPPAPPAAQEEQAAAASIAASANSKGDVSA